MSPLQKPIEKQNMVCLREALKGTSACCITGAPREVLIDFTKAES
jgi:hypothetical protein